MFKLNRLVRSKPKIIGITEVKPKHFRYNLQNCELAIENYEMFSSNIINNVGPWDFSSFF
jgi:hypothetical protein